MRSAPRSVVAIGFSTSTCLPAASASSAISACCAEGAAIETASTSLRPRPGRDGTRQSRAIGRRPMRSRARLLVGLGHGDDVRALDALPASRRGRSPMRPAPTTPTRASLMLPPPARCGEQCDARARRSARAARPSPNIGGRSAGRGRDSAALNASGSTPTSAFQPVVDGLDPLGLLAQGHAGHAPQVGLALHAAGVGGDRAARRARARACACRRRGRRARRCAAPSASTCASAARVRGCTGRITRQGERREAVEHGRRRSGASVL